MGRAWDKFMVSIHGCAGVGLMSAYLPIHPLAFPTMLIAVGLYSLGWFAEPSRRDAIFALATRVEQLAVIGAVASLAVAWQHGVLLAAILGFALLGRVAGKRHRRV